MQCPEKDLVWDRQCGKEEEHVRASTAEERLHCNELPGDRLTWGTVADMRAVEGN